jgi:hypothetical protein
MYLRKSFFKFFKTENTITKPIFIFGPPRSGTSITYFIMCAHPELAWFSTNDIKYWIPKKDIEKIKKDRLSIPSSREIRLMFDGPSKPGPDRSRLPKDLQPIEGNTFWNRFFKDWPKDDIPESSKHEIRKVIYDTIIRQNKIRFLNKAPLHSTRLFILKNIFPDAKFINLIREPRVTVASMLKKHEQEGGFAADFWPIKNKLKYEKFDLMQKYAWLYAEVIDSTYEFHNLVDEKNFMTVIYEEFMENPIKTLTKILNFCELNISINPEEMIPPLRETAHKWKEKFSLDEQKKIYDIVTPSVQKMKYPYIM